MTMVLDQHNRHYGGSMYDVGNSGMYSSHMGGQPQFNDPWTPATSQYTSLAKHDNRATGMPLHYSQLPTSAPMSSGSYYSSSTPAMSDVLSSQDIPRSTYTTEPTYSSSSTSQPTYAAAYPSSLNYAQSLHQQQQHQQHHKIPEPADNRSATAGFNELDASRGMLALSHQNLTDLTPRNIYEARAQRGSGDSSYGFPQAPSHHSSISAESGRSYPYYASSSVAGSVDSATDYSSAASDTGYDSMTVSRTLPRPSQLMGADLGVPAPQSMMGQFSSKMSSNTQKKHKCKVCDKRFTRPSSLQTHMYSHTGEKPFACNVEGCGRHFSVVSNLRRHKKVHKGESSSIHSDNDD